MPRERKKKSARLALATEPGAFRSTNGRRRSARVLANERQAALVERAGKKTSKSQQSKSNETTKKNTRRKMAQNKSTLTLNIRASTRAGGSSGGAGGRAGLSTKRSSRKKKVRNGGGSHSTKQSNLLSVKQQNRIAPKTPRNRSALSPDPMQFMPVPPPPSFRPQTFLKLENFPICQHISQINAINFDRVQRVITRPARWRCKECNHCNDAWVCLSCGHVGCGRFLGKHAYNHHAEAKSGACEIAMSITNGFCFCYTCDEYVISADHQGYNHKKGDHSELRLLQRMLADCKNQQFGESRTRRGSLIRKAENIWERNIKRGRLGLVTPADQKRQLQQDRIDTIVVHRRLLKLQKTFRAWQTVTKRAGHSDLKDFSPPALNQNTPQNLPKAKSSVPSTSNVLSHVPYLGADKHKINPLGNSAFLGSSSGSSVLQNVTSQASSISPRQAFHLIRSVITPSPRSYLAFERAEIEQAKQTGATTDEDLMNDYLRRASLIRPGRAGLNNLGNTCYINSVFQCLSHTLPFWKYFIRFRHNALQLFESTDKAQVSGIRRNSVNSSSKVVKIPSGPPPRILQRQSSSQCYDNATLRRGEVSEFLSSSGRRRKSTRNTKDSKKRKRSAASGNGNSIEKEDENVEEEDLDISLSSEIHNVLRVLWSGQWAVATPYSLVFAIWRFVPHFRSYLQQDAQEFYNSFIDAVHTELLEVAKKAEGILSKRNADENSAVVELAQVAKSAHKFIDTVFQGTGCSEILCLHCGHTSQREENFLSLSVMIPVEFQGKSKVVSSLKKVRSSVAKIKKMEKLKEKRMKEEASKSNAKRKRTGGAGVPNIDQQQSPATEAVTERTPIKSTLKKDSVSYGSASVRAARPRVLSSIGLSDHESSHLDANDQGGKKKKQLRKRLRSSSCTIQDCLAAHTAKEFLVGDSQYFCEKCDEKRDATKRLVSSLHMFVPWHYSSDSHMNNVFTYHIFTLSPHFFVDPLDYFISTKGSCCSHKAHKVALGQTERSRHISY